MDVVEPGNESRDLIHVEAPSTPKTETDADVAPLIQKVGATSIVEIEKLMGELPRVGGLERYVQNQPTGAIVGSVHRGPCADKQRVKGANRTARPDHAVVPLIRCADLRCTQVIEARFVPNGQSVRSQPLPQDEVAWFIINESSRDPNEVRVTCSERSEGHLLRTK